MQGHCPWPEYLLPFKSLPVPIPVDRAPLWEVAEDERYDIRYCKMVIVVSAWADRVWLPTSHCGLPIRFPLRPLRMHDIFSGRWGQDRIRPYQMAGGRHDGRHPLLIHNVLVGRHWDGSFLGSLLPWAELFDQWLNCDAAGDWILGIHVQCWQGVHRSLATAMVIGQMAVALHAEVDVLYCDRANARYPSKLCSSHRCWCWGSYALTLGFLRHALRDHLEQNVFRNMADQDRVWKIQCEIDHWPDRDLWLPACLRVGLT